MSTNKNITELTAYQKELLEKARVSSNVLSESFIKFGEATCVNLSDIHKVLLNSFKK